MKINTKNSKVDKVIKKFNKKVKIKRKMDSIVLNQLSKGTGIFYFDVTEPKLKVYDNDTVTIIHDPIADEFEGLWQRVEYIDPEQMKQGVTRIILKEGYIKPDDLILVSGIGKGYGESLLLEAYPYVKAKRELVNSLYELVKRLGLLTVVGVDLPGDISDDAVDGYLDEIAEMVEKAAANTTWILPKDCTVEGVRSSGEARIIESVKTVIDMLDEEIRKCIFVPDTFLTSLSANRATAKEQRYLIASMVQHIRDLIEEALIDMYDALLKHEGMADQEYTFSWGNINMPEPEALFTFLATAYQNGDGTLITEDEIRSYMNLGRLPPELQKKKKEKEKAGKLTQQGIYDQMSGKKPSNILSDSKGGATNGKVSSRQVQPQQDIKGQQNQS